MNNHFFDFYTEVSKNLVPKHKAVYVQGVCYDIDTNTVPEVVWTNGGDYTLPDTAEILGVVSSSPRDDADSPVTGVGASSVTITGLDENYNEVSFGVVLNGTSSVNTSPQKFVRVNKVEVHKINSSTANSASTTGVVGRGSNEGVISVFNSHSYLGIIPAGKGVSQSTLYTVPAGNTAYLTRLGVDVTNPGNSGYINMSIKQRAPFISDDYLVVEENRNRLTATVDVMSTNLHKEYEKNYKVPLRFEQGTDIWVSVDVASIDNIGVAADYTLIQVSNTAKYK